MKHIFIWPTIVISLSLLIFLLIPEAVYLLGFSGELFFSGEIWRLATFSFTHVDLRHIIENIFALGIVSLLAFEFELKSRHFVYCFSLTSILVALADGVLFPAVIIAGASLGTYAVLGSLSIKGSNFIPKFILIPLLGVSSFGITGKNIAQSMLHLSGFIAGILVFYMLISFRNKTRILQR
jgi:membrane associated rhomboid family serine protease